jgi:hypothetical protein
VGAARGTGRRFGCAAAWAGHERFQRLGWILHESFLVETRFIFSRNCNQAFVDSLSCFKKPYRLPIVSIFSGQREADVEVHAAIDWTF